MKYYITQNQIFSSQILKIEVLLLPKNLKIEISENNSISSNEMILEQLENLKINSTKLIQTSKPIENLDKIIEKIKSNKKEKPKLENMDFIEKTSSIEILEQFFLSIESSFSSIQIQKNLENYIKQNKKIKDTSLIQINKNILKLKKQKEDFSISNIKTKKEELEKLIKKKINFLNEINEQINKIENKLEENQKQVTKNNFQNEFKIQIFKDKIEKNELDKNIYQIKIKNITTSIKLGQKKCPNIFLMFVTFGLIWWSKYSTCIFKKVYFEKKILKKEEKNLNIKKKILKLKQSLEIEEKKLENNQKEILKNETILNKKYLNYQNKQNEVKSKLRNMKKDIEIQDKLYNNIKLKIEEVNKKLENSYELKEKYEKNSIKIIEEKILEFEKKEQNQKIEIKKILDKLKLQKIELEGDWIIEV